MTLGQQLQQYKTQLRAGWRPGSAAESFTLLRDPQPSAAATVTNGNVSNSVDRVSLLTFPPVLATTVANEYNCGSSGPSTSAYALPLLLTSTYQVVDFSSDYRVSDSATALNTSSNIVKAVGGKIRMHRHAGQLAAMEPTMRR